MPESTGFFGLHISQFACCTCGGELEGVDSKFFVESHKINHDGKIVVTALAYYCHNCAKLRELRYVRQN